MRISVDVHSIKDQNFRGNIFAKYNGIPELEITHFKTAPILPVPKTCVEYNFENSFKSYQFDTTKNKVSPIIDSKTIKIEVFHYDRNK